MHICKYIFIHIHVPVHIYTQNIYCNNKRRNERELVKNSIIGWILTFITPMIDISIIWWLFLACGGNIHIMLYPSCTVGTATMHMQLCMVFKLPPYIYTHILYNVHTYLH